MTAVHRTGWVTHKSSISACVWRIVISPAIPQDSPPCYDSLMRNLAVLFIHFIAVLARLLAPGGVRSLVAESLLLKHQILILNRYSNVPYSPALFDGSCSTNNSTNWESLSSKRQSLYIDS